MNRDFFKADTLDDIIQKVNTYISSKPTEMEKYERITHAGYFMRPHRDDYRYDKRTERWVALFDTSKRPLITAIWFHSTQGVDFIGGNLRFQDGDTYRPKAGYAIVFDPNDIHHVTLQQTKNGVGDTRHVTILKWYEIV